MHRQTLMMRSMSMGWGYVSELRPPTGLLLAPMWYTRMEKHGGIILRGKNSCFFQRALWQSRQERHLVAKQEKHGEGNEFVLRSIFVHASKWYFTCYKNLQHGAYGFTSPPKDSTLKFFLPLKSFALVVFEPARLGSNGKHANHYTTEATPTTLGWKILHQ
jgi:hypothetical protein